MRINEIFYSLQGEGYFTGTPSIFIRLSGCNLDCSFCDTQHTAYREMSEEEVMEAIAAYPAQHVVITGGEPLLQLQPSFVTRLHRAGKYVQIETNGTRSVAAFAADPIDWITCSPKFDFCRHAELQLEILHELKVVHCGQDLSVYDNITAEVYSLQPCDVGEPKRNAAIVNATMDYILRHPKWRLSLQTHKMLNIR